MQCVVLFLFIFKAIQSPYLFLASRAGLDNENKISCATSLGEQEAP